VKTNEKTARDALREIMSVTYGLPCDGAPDMILSRIRDVAQAALDATAGDLDRLVAWLEQDEGDYVSSEMQFTVIRVSRLLDHIREMKE